MLLHRKRCLHESQRKTLRLRFVIPRKDRSSRSQMFFKGVLKNLRNLPRKHVFESLFNRDSLIMLPVKYRKSLRIPFLQSVSGCCFWRRGDGALGAMSPPKFEIFPVFFCLTCLSWLYAYIRFPWLIHYLVFCLFMRPRIFPYFSFFVCV